MIGICLILIDEEDDKRTFEELYMATRKKAYSIAFRILNNRNLAEEACSEAYLKVAENFGRIKHLDEHQLDYYVVVAVQNTSCNFLKKEKKHMDNISLNEEEHYKLSDSIIEKQDMDTLVTLIGRLSEDDRRILYLRVVDGLDYNGIGVTLNITSAAARKRFSRAKSALAKLIEKERNE